MNPEKLRKLLLECDKLIHLNFPGVAPARNPSAVLLGPTVQHLRWMVQESLRFIEKGRTHEAARWLGYIEGSMVQLRIVEVKVLQFSDVLSHISEDPDESQ